jgi:small subunit ribosomal protein S9
MALKLNKKNQQVKKVIRKTEKTNKITNKSTQNNQGTTEFNLPNTKYVEAIGRRKVASARVRIYDKPGDFVVNDQAIGQYFGNIKNAAVKYNKPFELTGTKGKFAVTVKVGGSGTLSQLDAVVHGIARALVKYDPEFRTLIKPSGLLTRDDRMKETRKIGTGGKARRQRQSPRR